MKPIFTLVWNPERKQYRAVTDVETAIFFGMRTNPLPRNERNYDTSPSKPNRYYPVNSKKDGVIITEWVKR